MYGIIARVKANVIISFQEFRPYIIYGWLKFPIDYDYLSQVKAKTYRKYLYIGKSIRFIERIRDKNHKIGNIESSSPKDELHIWFCNSRQELNQLERYLIQRHQPKYNTNLKVKKNKEIICDDSKIIKTEFQRVGRFAWIKKEQIQSQVDEGFE